MKTIIMLLTVAFATVMISSCSSSGKRHPSVSTFEVTVLNNSQGLIDETVGASTRMHVCLAETKSGDTLSVLVPDSIYLSYKMPYRATMEKYPAMPRGTITEVLSKNGFQELLPSIVVKVLSTGQYLRVNGRAGILKKGDVVSIEQSAESLTMSADEKISFGDWQLSNRWFDKDTTVFRDNYTLHVQTAIITKLD